jgi:hypothetical protein
MLVLQRRVAFAADENRMSKEEGMAFKVKQCRGVNARTGEPCRQPALKGGDYCRFHQEKPNQEKPGGTGDDSAGPEDTTDEKRRGGKPGNQNATRHGAYSLQLLPEEGSIYEEKRASFTAQLGELNAFDSQVVHMLSLIAAKLDVAACGGAPAEALIPISNEILKLLRSLKETRDSRDEAQDGAPKTFADFLAEASSLAGERKIVRNQEDMLLRVFEMEAGVNELRKQLNLPPRDDISHRSALCVLCRKDTSQRRNQMGQWICLACGTVAVDEPGASNPPDSGMSQPESNPQ